MATKPKPEPEPKPKPKPFWDDEAALGEVKRSDTHVYRIGYGRKGRREYITMRYWYWQEASQSWKPTRNGMNIDFEQIAEVIEVLMHAAVWAGDHVPTT
jgi:hypothetical protein